MFYEEHAYFMAVFHNDHDVLQATEESRTSGFVVHDVFTPFPIHGMDEAMGLRPSRLPWVCFLFAMTGFLISIWLQYWVSAVSWPINVGGRPWNSWPAFAPVCFEVMVLCAGLGTVATLLVRCGLLPGKKAQPILPGVTDNLFALVLRKEGAEFDTNRARLIMKKNNVSFVEEWLGERL